MNDVVQLVQTLGVNPAIVVAIMFVTAMIKNLDSKDRFKRWYTFLPLIASLIVCIPTFKGAWFVQTLIHAGISAWFYDIYAGAIKHKTGIEE